MLFPSRDCNSPSIATPPQIRYQASGRARDVHTDQKSELGELPARNRLISFQATPTLRPGRTTHLHCPNPSGWNQGRPKSSLLYSGFKNTLGGLLAGGEEHEWEIPMSMREVE